MTCGAICPGKMGGKYSGNCRATVGCIGMWRCRFCLVIPGGVLSDLTILSLSSQTSRAVLAVCAKSHGQAQSSRIQPCVFRGTVSPGVKGSMHSMNLHDNPCVRQFQQLGGQYDGEAGSNINSARNTLELHVNVIGHELPMFCFSFSPVMISPQMLSVCL